MPRTHAFFVAALLTVAAPPLAAPYDGDPIPVLVVGGANNHDWEWTTPSLASILEESGRFEVEVTQQPAHTLASVEHLRTKEVILLDYNGPRWGEPAERAFLQAVSGGVGVAIVHAADNAFEGWKEYEELVGLLWREGTGHGRFHPFDVTVVDRDHPLTATLPTLKAHPDELYHKLVNPQGVANRVLASAFSAEETGGTGVDEPMIIVRSYGSGRVFHTPLGHVWRNVEASRASHLDPQFRSLIVRGTEWAARGYVADGERHPNRLTSFEQQAGWQLLFDGESTAGWRSYGRTQGTPGWEVVSGCLVRTGGGGDIITEETFEDFELELEWKIAAGTNSGVKLRVKELPERGAPLGPEFQILDDDRHPQEHPNQMAATLYDVVPAEGKRLAPIGYFNKTRVVANGSRLEYWLNGVRTVSVDLDSEEFADLKARSKFKDVEDFGRGVGHIALQDHGGEVWFRTIKLRRLPQPTGERVELLEDDALTGWTALGDAEYSKQEDSILGRVRGGSQSFLITEESYGDFVFNVDVMTEAPGNSGIQIRSHQRDGGRVFGYQIEIDPSQRAWSGGLYDEARRGWLSSLEGKEAARASYRHREWNRYRIQCIGPWITVRVNGVPTVDYIDPLDLEGFIGLQVHSGNSTQARWRNPVVWRLGRRSWEPLFDGSSLEGWSKRGESWTLEDGQLSCDGISRLQSEATDEDGSLRIRFRQTGLGFSVAAHCNDGAMEPSDRRTSGLWTSSGGWSIRPAELAGFAPGKLHTLVVTCLGDRVAAHLDDKLVLDEDQLPGPLEGSWGLHLFGGEVSVQSIERLGDPR